MRVNSNLVIWSQRGVAIRLAVALVATLCVFVPSTRGAHASTGGGCGNTIYAPFAALTACISASGNQERSDAYMHWYSIPPGACSVELDLVNNTTGVVYESLFNMPCGNGYYGPMSAIEGNNTYWYALLTVRTSRGTYDATSYVQHLTY